LIAANGESVKQWPQSSWKGLNVDGAHLSAESRLSVFGKARHRKLPSCSTNCLVLRSCPMQSSRWIPWFVRTLEPDTPSRELLEIINKAHDHDHATLWFSHLARSIWTLISAQAKRGHGTKWRNLDLPIRSLERYITIQIVPGRCALCACSWSNIMVCRRCNRTLHENIVRDWKTSRDGRRCPHVSTVRQNDTILQRVDVELGSTCPDDQPLGVALLRKYHSFSRGGCR
jgi:hypothetical protein